MSSSWTLVLLLLLTAFARADTFSAQAIDPITGNGVSNAQVYLQSDQDDGTQPHTNTDTDGRFSFTADAPFALQITHPDYEDFKEVARSNPAPTVVYELISRNAAALTPQEQAMLAQYRSPDGRSLFLFPYQLRQDIDGFDDILAFHLDIAINARLQALGAGIINVQPLPGELAQQPNRTVLYGQALNALAIVSGRSGNKPNGNIALRSRYRIVPGGQGVVGVTDEFSPAAISEAALDEHLSDVWGQSTLLSVAYREFDEATRGAQIDRLRLERALSALQALQRDLPDPGSFLAREVEQLIANISERLDA
jgi:hypothetical protein